MAASGKHNGRYILVGKIPVPCEDLVTWAHWLEENRRSRIVRQEDVGKFEVSTVFLGLDHSFSEDQPPLLFETMVFCDPTEEERREFHPSITRINPDDSPCYRATTWEMALESHERAVEWARRQQLQ